MSIENDIGGLLHQEHLNTLAVVNELEDRVLGRSREKPVDAAERDWLRQLIVMIDNDIDRHFAFEEDELFPEVARRGLGDITGMLTQEHATIRPMAEQLRALADRAIEESLSREDWEAFRDTGMDFIHAVMFHVQKEEMGIIRRLPALIDAATNRAFAERYLASAF